LSDYLNFNYPGITTKNLQVLLTISRILGNYKFLQSEVYLRKQYRINSNLFEFNEFRDSTALIKYFYNMIMTEQEKIKLSSFNVLKNHCKINLKKKNFSYNPRQMPLSQSTNPHHNVSSIFAIEDKDKHEMKKYYSPRKINKYKRVLNKK
jgi:hypothetical protein